MAVLCFALVGCGGGVDKSNYTGDWTLTSSSNANIDEKSVELMKSLGVENSLTLNDNGSGTLRLLGDSSDVTWEATSNASGTLKRNGNSSAIRLEDGKLTLEDVEGSSYVFSRA